MCASSVCSERRNFFRAGTLKNRSRTVIDVPGASAASSQRSILPPAISTTAPVDSVVERVSSNKRETEAIEGSASPRNPSVAMERRSLTSCSLLVAWRSKASMASSRDIPQPSSLIRIRRRPPASTSMRKFVEPASSEFSSSSLTTDAGRSTTSPAAILLATFSGSTWIRPIELQCFPLKVWQPLATLAMHERTQRRRLVMTSARSPPSTWSRLQPPCHECDMVQSATSAPHRAQLRRAAPGRSPDAHRVLRHLFRSPHRASPCLALLSARDREAPVPPCASAVSAWFRPEYGLRAQPSQKIPLESAPSARAILAATAINQNTPSLPAAKARAPADVSSAPDAYAAPASQHSPAASLH